MDATLDVILNCINIIVMSGMLCLEVLVWFLALLFVVALCYHIYCYVFCPKEVKRVIFMVLLGSGGHTREVLNLIPKLISTGWWADDILLSTIYVAAVSDPLSLVKARQTEVTIGDPTNGVNKREIKYFSVYRVREVGERWFSVIFVRVPIALKQGFLLIFREKPTVILCNGPGLCVPICLAAVFFNLLRITSTKIVFTESLCRVNSFSMTGKIMLCIADLVLVQWKELKLLAQTIPYCRSNVRYVGRIPRHQLQR